eukprot:SAG31_NODE_162_length_21892_cov_343.171936_13_plen_82_part_00
MAEKAQLKPHVVRCHSKLHPMFMCTGLPSLGDLFFSRYANSGCAVRAGLRGPGGTEGASVSVPMAYHRTVGFYVLVSEKIK